MDTKPQSQFAVGALQLIVEQNERELTNAECQFLIGRIRELERVNLGLDLAAQHWQEECRQQWCDLKGAESSIGDLEDKLRQVTQDLELARMQLDLGRQAAEAAI